MNELVRLFEYANDCQVQAMIKLSTKAQIEELRHVLSFTSKENQERWEKIMTDTMNFSEAAKLDKQGGGVE